MRISHFVLRNARVGFRIAQLRKRLPVDLLHRIEHLAAHLAIHSIRIAQIEHRIAARAQSDTRILRRKKTAAPQPRRNRLVIFLRVQLASAAP